MAKLDGSHGRISSWICHCSCITDGLCRLAVPSIRTSHYFWPIVTPSPCHTLSHIPGPQKYVTHLRPPIFSRPSTKNPDKSPLYKFSLNCSWGFFVWGVLSGGLLSGRFYPGWFLSVSSFCQNTSVTTES